MTLRPFHNLLALLPAAALTAQTLTFTEVSLNLGSSPKSIHFADFNGDRNPDIVVVNSAGANQNHVTVALGNGDGTFSDPIFSATGGFGAIALTAGDFNHDGLQDLAVVNNLTSNVSILFGNGDGTLRSGGLYNVGQSPIAIAAADLNRDGNRDLVIVSSFAPISILLGQADGTFQRGIDIVVPNGASSVKIGDFNRDRIPDLAVSDGTLGQEIVAVFLGNGDGTFRSAGTAATGNEPFSIAIGDFNRDGRQDLAVANLASNDVAILMGKGDGTFTSGVRFPAPSGPVAIRTADFTKDRQFDLAVCADLTSQVLIYPGTGDGTFQPAQTFPSGGVCNSLAVGDVNHDRKPDLIVANTTGVTLLLNTSN
ncbi:MAG: VCBS repeat-containing protein [Bryobacteraceae bacterium]